jgi:hypothetical protein
MSDFIKQASKHLQKSFQQNHQVKVGSSHAHAVISGALGYKSKVALLSDNEIIPLEDEFRLHQQGGDVNEEFIATAIDQMKETPLKNIPLSTIADTALEALTPACECCGNKTLDSQPVFNSDNPDTPIAQVCVNCKDHYYGHCEYCGTGTLYRSIELNRSGECKEHRGEGSYDDEEIEDIQSYAEYHTKDF